MTSPAYQPVLSTTVPLALAHDGAETVTPVDVDCLATGHCFDVVRAGAVEDISLSVSLSPERITLVIPEPADLVLTTDPQLEQALPPMAIATCRNGVITPLRLLGSTKPLAAPIQVARVPETAELIVQINLPGSASNAPLPSAYCKLAWTVNSLPRSIRFASAGASGGPLILRPKRED